MGERQIGYSGIMHHLKKSGQGHTSQSSAEFLGRKNTKKILLVISQGLPEALRKIHKAYHSHRGQGNFFEERQTGNQNLKKVSKGVSEDGGVSRWGE